MFLTLWNEKLLQYFFSSVSLLFRHGRKHVWGMNFPACFLVKNAAALRSWKCSVCINNLRVKFVTLALHGLSKSRRTVMKGCRVQMMLSYIPTMNKRLRMEFQLWLIIMLITLLILFPQTLLRHGANPDLRDEDGKTPMDKARERNDEGHREVVHILQSPGTRIIF